MKYGLADDVMTQITNVFVEDHNVLRVIIFGPRATGNFKSTSSIYLAISGNNLGPDDIPEFYEELDQLGLPYTFQLELLNAIKDSDLIDHIAKEGKPFYKKP